MADCVFCMIANKTIPSDCIYEDDLLMAFKDLNPVAPVHFLVIPKEHYESMDAINETNSSIVAKCFELIPKLAKEQGIGGAYRVVSNCGEDAGQTVKHLHFHVIGGKKLD